MSEDKHYRGTLEEVKLVDGDLRKTLIQLLSSAGREVEEDDDDDIISDYMYEEYEDTYIKVNKTRLYKILKEESVDAYDGFFLANKNTDGTISFDVKFYNGGCCKSEAIEQAIKDMEK